MTRRHILTGIDTTQSSTDCVQMLLATLAQLLACQYHNMSVRMCRGATPRDHRILPRRIILVRHAESEGNIDNFAYTYVPDPQVPLVSPYQSLTFARQVLTAVLCMLSRRVNQAPCSMPATHTSAVKFFWWARAILPAN